MNEKIQMIMEHFTRKGNEYPSSYFHQKHAKYDDVFNSSQEISTGKLLLPGLVCKLLRHRQMISVHLLLKIYFDLRVNYIMIKLQNYVELHFFVF